MVMYLANTAHPHLSLVSIYSKSHDHDTKDKEIMRLSSHSSHLSLCFDSKLVVVVVEIGFMETRLNTEDVPR